MQEPNKTPSEDYIRLSRKDYEVILEAFRILDEVLEDGLKPQEKEVRSKVEKIIENIKKFNAQRFAKVTR